MLRKKILSLVAALAMLASSAPTFAYAEGGGAEAEAQLEAEPQLEAAAENESQYQSTENGEWQTGSLKDAVANVYEGGTIKVLSDITLTESITVSQSLTITSADPENPCTVSYNGTEDTGRLGEYYGMIFTVNPGNFDFALADIILDGGRDQGKKFYHSLICVLGARLRLLSGAVIQNNYNQNDVIGGGAVFLRGGQVYMYEGSKITSCYCKNGGGVEVNGTNIGSAAFGINGGIIENCEAVSGGGAYVNVGQFHLFDGEIRNNSVTGADLHAGGGGGIYVSGGSDYNARGMATIQGGSITDNTSDFYGGGVCVYDEWANLAMRNNGVISGNSAKYGAGIAGVEGNISLYSGEITGNEAVENAGGVFCAPTCNITISGELGGDLKVKENNTGNNTDNLYLDANEDAGDITSPIRIKSSLSEDTCLNISRETLPDDKDKPGKITLKPSELSTYTITESDLQKIHSDDKNYGFVLHDGSIQMVLPVDVTLDQTELTLEGEPKQFTATITPENALVKDVTWSSSDESIATVDESGVVTPVSNGKCTITATPVSPHKSTASCEVTVDLKSKVTFDANDGAWSNGDITETVPDIPYDSEVGNEMPENPTRTGFIFKGWFMASGVRFTKYTAVTCNMTVYAQWTETPSKELTVRFYEHKDNKRIYDIVVESKDGNPINRLSATELKFALKLKEGTKGAIGYEITPAENVNMVENNGAFEFNFDGVDTPDKSGPEVKIGEVEFTGYGEFHFACVSYADAKVNTAKLADNIVDTYIPGGDGETVGRLTLNGENGEINIESEDSIIHPEFIPAAKKLTINVTFPNEAKNNIPGYQDMAIKVSGGDLTEAQTIQLGKADPVTDAGENVTSGGFGNGTYTVTYTGKTAAEGETPAADASYAVVIDNALTENIAYTVTVEGAGYRTARHTVTMTEDKVLNFWNNVKDTPASVEAGKTAMKNNFLAGDIVKDNNINLYDLSAVISYFGTANDITAFSEYAKYDLNRDGKIDSKDIAYVLVSWNN